MSDDISQYRKLWRRRWCLMMFDALDGPMISRPIDKESQEEYASRKTARSDITDGHPEYYWIHDNAWGDALDPDRVRDAFADGRLNSDAVWGIWQANGGD